MDTKKIIFTYIPDMMFINSESTPFGMISLNEILNCAGYDSEIIDFNMIFHKNAISNTSNLMIKNLKNIAQTIVGRRPFAVSFYTMCSNFYACIYVAKLINEIDKNIIIIMAGPHATSVSKPILESFMFVKYVAMGEGENTIIPFVEAITENDNNKIMKLEGVAFRNDEKIIVNWDRKKRIYGSKLPFVDVGKYIKINESTFVSIEGGRGCPFNCIFCSTQMFWGNVFVIKPVDNLLNEIKFYHEKYGVHKFSISHDLFTANKRHILEFSNAVLNLNFSIKWACSSRLDVLDVDVLSAMIHSGCSDIYMGIESGSPKIQKLISKNLKIDEINKTLKFLLNNNVNCIFSFIFGYPFEKYDDLRQTLSLIHKLKVMESKINNKKLLTIQLHRITFLPGTSLAKDYYNDLEYEGINTMSYYDETFCIPEQIKDIIINNKECFLNCYNLTKNKDCFYLHIGDFICYIYDEMYYYFPITINKLIEINNNEIFFLIKDIFEIDSECYYEICKFHNLNFGKNKLIIMINVFNDIIKELIDIMNIKYSDVKKILYDEFLNLKLL